ncbi:MAG: DNA mismatch repair protein MutS [Bacteroidetes bacterium]|nr:MAG: DNA mismatch repair protein MutS [Bacteroidota bacterium]
MKFQVGERVGFLSDSGEAIVRKVVSEQEVVVEDEFGFEQSYPVNQLVKLYGSPELEQMAMVGKDEETPEQKLRYQVRQERSGKPQKTYWELDLHIESLIDDHRGLGKFEILKLQMAEFKKFFEKAKASKMMKLIVIHGIGEGILKEEIRSFLNGRDGVEFFDASYQEYGKGATEIRLRVTMMDD